jgi:pyruvate dehydrogenase E1 component alpha subunit
MASLHQIEGIPETREDDVERIEDAYPDMLRIRLLEEASSELYEDGKIRGFCHLFSGEESLAVGIKLAKEEGDGVIGSYRCHGYALVCGVGLKEIMCELVGSNEGCAKGKGGSMHLYSKCFFGGHGIVGAQVPLGLGLAFSYKYRVMAKGGVDRKAHGGDDLYGWTVGSWRGVRSENVAFVTFGDGAANQGQVYESMNMARLWELPVVFVCENNLYGMGTSVARASATESFYDRFSFVPGIRIDGKDVVSVWKTLRFCREYALEKGPIFVEIQTYRYVAHSKTELFKGYREDKEIRKKELDDCVKIAYEKYLKLVGKQKANETSEAIRKEMEEARAYALGSKQPWAEELFTDILL